MHLYYENYSHLYHGYNIDKMKMQHKCGAQLGKYREIPSYYH